jgi:hypothetical protein
VLLGVVDEQALERADVNVREVRGDFPQHLLALLEREQRLRLLRVADHGHDDVLEVARRPLDDVEMTVRHRVERSRAQCSRHAL